MTGGVVSTTTCEEIWAEDENATCELSVLNRAVYPVDRSVHDTDDMTCYLPHTWIEK